MPGRGPGGACAPGGCHWPCPTHLHAGAAVPCQELAASSRSLSACAAVTESSSRRGGDLEGVASSRGDSGWTARGWRPGRRPSQSPDEVGVPPLPRRGALGPRPPWVGDSSITTSRLSHGTCHSVAGRPDPQGKRRRTRSVSNRPRRLGPATQASAKPVSPQHATLGARCRRDRERGAEGRTEARVPQFVSQRLWRPTKRVRNAFSTCRPTHEQETRFRGK